MISPVAQQPPVVQVTEYDHPDVVVEGSSWGEVTNEEWTNRDLERMQRKGACAFVRHNGGGRIAIFRTIR